MSSKQNYKNTTINENIKNNNKIDIFRCEIKHNITSKKSIVIEKSNIRSQITIIAEETITLEKVLFFLPIKIKCRKLICKGILSSSINLLILENVSIIEFENIEQSTVEFNGSKTIQEISVLKCSILIDIIKYTKLKKLSIKNSEYWIYSSSLKLEEIEIEGYIAQNTINILFNASNNINKLTLNCFSDDYINLEEVLNVTQLKLSNCKIDSLTLGNKITEIKVDNCSINNITVKNDFQARKISLWKMENLFKLLINEKTTYLNLKNISFDFDSLIKLKIRTLLLNECHISYGEKNLKTLRKLSLENCNYNRLLLTQKITDLRIKNCNLNNIDDIMNLENLKKLKLEYNHIRKLPLSVSCLGLEVLNLSNNELTELKDISVLSKLKELILDDNYNLRYINENIISIKTIEFLGIANCVKLVMTEQIREWIGNMTGFSHYQSHIINLPVLLFFINETKYSKKIKNVKEYINANEKFTITYKLETNSKRDNTFVSLLKEELVNYLLINESDEFFSFIKEQEYLIPILKLKEIANIRIFFNLLMQMVLMNNVIFKHIFLKNRQNNIRYLLRGEKYIKTISTNMKRNINKVISQQEYEPIVKLNIIMNIIFSTYN